MGVITDVTQAQIKGNVKTLYGKILTRPALLVTDGINVIYACDVDIGLTDPTGTINQITDPNTGNPIDLVGLPGQVGFTLNDTLTIGTVLHNVTIARGNADLIYADVGSPVRLDRSFSGQWQITGFSQEMPGTYTLIPVNLSDMSIGPIVDLSIDGRLLTLGELGSFAPFGTLPFGASGIFVGGVLRQIV